jgi:hypothetical protein
MKAICKIGSLFEAWGRLPDWSPILGLDDPGEVRKSSRQAAKGQRVSTALRRWSELPAEPIGSGFGFRGAAIAVAIDDPGEPVGVDEFEARPDRDEHEECSRETPAWITAGRTVTEEVPSKIAFFPARNEALHQGTLTIVKEPEPHSIEPDELEDFEAGDARSGCRNPAPVDAVHNIEERAFESGPAEGRLAGDEPFGDACLRTETDYYEVMQISRQADSETIHRVYRMMALRLHPDNARSGDLERFLLLRRAYRVLSDPAARARYDAAHLGTDSEPLPIFELRDFVDGMEGEVNRRLGVLSLLYHRRRKNEAHSGISMLDLERRMAFPREYLDFTLWYLRGKGYVTIVDNSDYALTVEGADYVEAQAAESKVIRELLIGPAKPEARALPRRSWERRRGQLRGRPHRKLP